MNEVQKQGLMALLFKAVGDYYEMSMHVLQKNVLNNKRPQQWMVDSAFQNITQNTTQFTSTAANPVPTTSGSGIDMGSILKLLAGNGSPANTDSTQADPPADTIVVNGQTYTQVIDTND